VIFFYLNLIIKIFLAIKVKDCFKKLKELLEYFFMSFIDKLSSNVIARYLAAAILLVSPLLSYPLVWGKIVDNFVPLWGDVECFTLGEIAMLAAAFIILFPEKIINALQE
jgi:hypothetical protein